MDYRISYVCVSHRGLFRQIHQDNFLCDGHILPHTSRGTVSPIRGIRNAGNDALFGVFDGMGGEEMGEMAAFLAAQTAAQIRLGDQPQDDLLSFCRDASDTLTDYILANRLSAMGTTASVLSFTGAGIWLCHLGDSRIYRLRDGMLKQLTADHVLPWFPGRKPPLALYLGIPQEEEVLTPQILRLMPQAEDIYLICSDGLTDMVSRDEILHILNTTPYEKAAEVLLSRALSNGGRDNVTVITCKTQESARIPMFIKRLFRKSIV